MMIDFDEPGAEAPELKFMALDLKRVDGAGVFEGYAAYFNREDMGHDVVQPGAFRECLAKRGAQGIRMLYQHDAHQPIGTWSVVREDARGLFVVGRLASDVTKAQEVLALMRDGALDGLSIGFRAMKSRRDPRTGVRRLERIDLLEISVVTFPMQPEARVMRVKASPFAAGVPTEREFERWLTRDAGLTRSEARALAAHGFKGLLARRDASLGLTPQERLALSLSEASARLRAAATGRQSSN
jgi:hypothetical protein